MNMENPEEPEEFEPDPNSEYGGAFGGGEVPEGMPSPQQMFSNIQQILNWSHMMGKNILGEVFATVVPSLVPSRYASLVCPPSPGDVAKLKARFDQHFAEAKALVAKAKDEGSPPTREIMQALGQVAQDEELLKRAQSLVN